MEGGRKKRRRRGGWLALAGRRASHGTGTHRVRGLLLAWVLWEPPTSTGIFGVKGGTAQISETDTRWSQAEFGEVKQKDKQVSLLQQNCRCFLSPRDNIINHLSELITNRVSGVYPNPNFSER